MSRPIRARICPAHLAHNLAALRARLTPGAELMAVIKANAYGHGIERVYPALGAANSLALLDLDEARRVRALGWSAPVLLLEGAFTYDDYSTVARLQLDFTLHNAQQVVHLQRFFDSGERLDGSRVFVKVNTGMNRLGFVPDEALAVMLQALGWLSRGLVAQVVLMTHYANADEAKPAGPDAPTQADRLMKLAARVRQQADDGGLAAATFTVSLGNSAAALGHTQIAGDIVRTGIAVWGASTGPLHADEAGLKPVMRLSSRIIGVQQLQPGERVGYGSRFAATKPMRIGVVACGYADGYPRHAPDGTPVNVAGVRTAIVGRVSMDMLTVDLTDIPHADLGSEVVLFGDEGLGVDEVATACGTIGYELLCAIAPRVPFEVEGNGFKHLAGSVGSGASGVSGVSDAAGRSGGSAVGGATA
jgi:alanine racemase